jgi:peptide-methionine (S)-S-oxide reductase
MEKATFAGGCFWCTEAVFQRLKGVSKVTSGYANSDVPDPTYEQVGGGGTGAAEAIQIEFDPKAITYSDLLNVFFATHDPTTLNRQGADAGTQYRSAIFYHDEAQKESAELKKAKITNAVTEISEFKNFTEAEDYHKDYYNQNKGNVYCKLVIDPKVKKLMKEFKDKVKT